MSALPVFTGVPVPATPQLRLADRDLECEVLPSLHAAEALRHEWNDLAARSGAALTMTEAWCRNWHEHDDPAESRLFTFRDGGRLVGVLPITIHRRRLGPLTLRVARVTGTEGPGAACAPPIEDSWRTTALTFVLNRLVMRDRCDAVHFDPVPGGSWIEAVRTSCATLDDRLEILEDRAAAPAMAIDLPEQFDEWRASLSRNQRATLRKGARRLESLGPINTEAIGDPREMPGALDALVRDHELQWNERGRPGHFRDWPGALRLHGAFVHDAAPEGLVRFHHLRAGSTVVARQYLFTLGRLAACRFASRARTEDADRSAAGQVSLAHLFEDLHAAGIRHIDLGFGRYAYKARLGAREIPHRSLLIAARRSSSLHAVRAYRAATRAIDFAYYRVWYHRMAPLLARRFDVRRRGLSRTWIRTRL